MRGERSYREGDLETSRKGLVPTPPRLANLVLAISVAACVLPSPEAAALTASGEIAVGPGNVRYAVFAPQWIWQRQNVNIIASFENSSPTTTIVEAILRFPRDRADHFAYTGPTSRSLVLPPRGRGRLAFANILTSSEKRTEGDGVEKIAPASYRFTIELRAESLGATKTLVIAYPLKTVRGAVVRQGLLATWLPVLLILFWCGVIFLIVPRMARPGAWKTPSDPFSGNE